MYTQSSFGYDCDRVLISGKGNKKSKYQTNWFCDQFNHFYRNRDRIKPEVLFEQIKQLTISFLNHLVRQKPKKLELEDILNNNLALGLNSKNKDIIFFHVKLTQLYLKSELNLGNLVASLQLLDDSSLLESQFHQHFFINLAHLESVKNQKLKSLIQRATSYLFKHIQIDQHQKHKTFLNYYLSQSVLFHSFPIFYEIICNYYQKLRDKNFKYPTIDINVTFQTLFNFTQRSDKQLQGQYRHIIGKYFKLFQNQNYIPYLMKDFVNIYQLVTSYLQLNHSKENQWLIVYFYNVLIDQAEKGVVFDLDYLCRRNQQCASNTNNKLFFFLSMYVRIFKNPLLKSVADLDQKEVIEFLTLTQNNISTLIISDHNFIRVVDKDVNQIQKIKRSFLKENSSNDIFLLSRNLKNVHAMQMVKKLTQIQNLILSNTHYLAVDNFKNSSYFATSALIEIIVQFSLIYQKQSSSVETVMKKWIAKINSLNLQYSDKETFYLSILNILTKKFMDNCPQATTQTIFNVFQIIFLNIPYELIFNAYTLNYLTITVKRSIKYLQQKRTQRYLQNDYYTQIKHMDKFIKILTQFVAKSTLKYFGEIQCQKNNEAYQKSNAIHNLSSQLFCLSVVLFCLNFQKVTGEEAQRFIKIFRVQLLSHKLAKGSYQIKNQLLDTLQTYISSLIQGNKVTLNKKDLQMLGFFFQFYTNINKIGYIRKNNQKNQYLPQNLKRINFVMYLKYNLCLKRKDFSLYQLIENLQKSILGCPCQIYIEKKCSQKELLSQVKQTNLQLTLDVLSKNIYFVSHPQISYFQGFNNSFEKKEQLEGSQARQQPQISEIKTKRQNRQKHEKYFQKSTYDFQNTCIILSKVRKVLFKCLSKLNEPLKSFKSITLEQSKIQVFLFQPQNIKNFLSISNLLSFTWNLLWILKVSDMKKQLQMIIKVRLGIFYYFSKLLSQDKTLQFQVDKLIFLQLIQGNGQLIKKAKLNLDQNYQRRILSNSLDSYEIQKVNYRLQTVIYLLNNLPSSKGYKTLISYISASIFQGQRLSYDTLASKKIELFTFFSQNITKEQRKIKETERLFLGQNSGFNLAEMSYPLITLMIRKLIKFVIKNNQLSEMRSLLHLITCYFSKIGLGIYYDELVQMWLLKKFKVNIIKVMDCYRILFNNSFCSRDQNQNQNQQKSKIFSKIDRLLCNKRRSISVHFSLKTITQLIKSIKKAQIPMNLNISRIIIYQLKEQFNLYNYEVEAIMHSVYSHNNIPRNQQFEKQPSQSQRIKLSYIADKVVFQKQFFNDPNKQKSYDYVVDSLKYICLSLPRFVLQSFRTAEIAQSLLGFFIQKLYDYFEGDGTSLVKIDKRLAYKLIDQTLVKLSIVMMQFNYQFKDYIYQCEEVENIHRNELKSIHESLQLNKKQFKKFQERFQNQIDHKLDFIYNSKKGNQLKYPISIIYPLRNWVYNISVIDSVLITKVEMFNFDHSISKIEQFIDNDSQIIFKEKSVKDWWKKRTRLDRQMGKIAQNTDLGVFDVKTQPKMKFKSVEHQRFNKFIFSNLSQIKVHLDHEISKENLSQQKQKQILKQLGTLNQIMTVNHCSGQQNYKINQNITILTVNRLSIFPFQKLKSLKKYHGIYRVPSVKYVMQQQEMRQLQKDKAINIRNLSYVINTHNDLKQTQKRFMQIKEKVYKKAGGYVQWDGVIGRKPEKSQFLNFFNNQVYMYMGHGTGMSHLKQKQFYKTKINSLSMIFGCSSINMQHQNSQPHGIPLILLRNKCPVLLGSMWQVTDRDTDLLTSKLFEYIINQQGLDLSYCLQRSKQHLRLGNLNGAAIVIYGLPCKVTFK